MFWSTDPEKADFSEQVLTASGRIEGHYVANSRKSALWLRLLREALGSLGEKTYVFAIALFLVLMVAAQIGAEMRLASYISHEQDNIWKRVVQPS